MSNSASHRADDFDFKVDVKSMPLAPVFIKIDKPMDVIQVLHAYALRLKFGLIILSALGTVRKVVLPLTTKKTYDEGLFHIMSLSGKITPLKRGKFVGGINLVMSDIHGAMIGGMVQNLFAETTVEVTVCPFYNDMSLSHPLEFDSPIMFGNPFLPSPIPYSRDESSSDQNSTDANSIHQSLNNPSSVHPNSGD